MKLSKKHKIALVELLIVVILLLWLFFPRPFESAMGYDFDWDQVTEVTATLEAGGETREVTLAPGQTDYEEFKGLLESQKYLIAGIGETEEDRENRNNRLGCEVTLFFDTEDTDFTLAFCGDQVMDFTSTAGDQARSFQAVDGLPFQEDLLALLLSVEPLEDPAT